MRDGNGAEFSWAGEDIFADMLRKLRSRLHCAPELSLSEHKTTHLLRTELLQLGLEPVELGLDTGVAALLKGGLPGPTVALRADIDALPIQEETHAEDASANPGIMHACGHDIHMTALLGAAALLVRRRESLCGSVLFLFQPAEEMDDGAEAVINSGLFRKFPVVAMFGLHVWPQLPLGQVGLRAGVLMSAKDSFEIMIRGRGGHGSTPQAARDPIPAGSALVTALQTIVSRNIAPQEQAVVSVCSVHAGSCDNVIPDEYVLQGSVRTFSAEIRNTVLTRVEEMSHATAAAYGCTAECMFLPGTPMVVNDSHLVSVMRESAAEVLGPEACRELEPVMISEDFASYGAVFPTCFALVGVGGSGGGEQPLHSPRFYPDAKVLVPAATLLADTALRCLKKAASS